MKKILCILFLSIFLLTDLTDLTFAGGTIPQKRIAVRHVFIEDTSAGAGLSRYVSECFKLLEIGEETYIKNLDDCPYVNNPISENSVPSAVNGLLNPDAPIKLYAFKDKISFGFLIDSDWNEDVMIRVFDESGKLLGSLSGSDVVDKNYRYHDDEKVIEFTAPQTAKNYYVEFSYDKSSGNWAYEKLNSTKLAMSSAASGFWGAPVPAPSLTSQKVNVLGESKKVTIPSLSALSFFEVPASTPSLSSSRINISNGSNKLNTHSSFALGFFGIPVPTPSIPSPRIKVPDGSSKKSKTPSSKSSSKKSSNSKAKSEDRVYCYILFSVGTLEPDLLPEEVKEIENMLQQYMKEKNISSYSDLYSIEHVADKYTFHEELRYYFTKKQIYFYNVADWRRNFSMMHISEVDNTSMKYLTKHKISSIESMTDQQIIALRASMIDWTYTRRPESANLVKNFRKKYGITSYENMTINELNRLERIAAEKEHEMQPIYQKQYQDYLKQQNQKQTSSSKSKSSSSSSKKKKSK